MIIVYISWLLGIYCVGQETKDFFLSVQNINYFECENHTAEQNGNYVLICMQPKIIEIEKYLFKIYYLTLLNFFYLTLLQIKRIHYETTNCVAR